MYNVCYTYQVPPSETRSQLIAVRLTPTELRMLKELADADGLYQSDVLRLLVRRAHGERFDGPPKAKRTRR